MKLTARPPATPKAAPAFGTFRTWPEIKASTDDLNRAIAKADKGRKTLKTPSPLKFSEQPRLHAVL